MGNLGLHFTAGLIIVDRLIVYYHTFRLINVSFALIYLVMVLAHITPKVVNLNSSFRNIECLNFIQDPITNFAVFVSFSYFYQIGMLYNHLDGISYIRRAAKFYKIDRFNLIGM